MMMLCCRCEKEEDLAMIAAQQYYIEYSTDLNSERLLSLLPNYIPDYCLTGDKPLDYWHQLITQAFRKVHIFSPYIFWTRYFCPFFLIHATSHCIVSTLNDSTSHTSLTQNSWLKCPLSLMNR